MNPKIREELHTLNQAKREANRMAARAETFEQMAEGVIAQFEASLQTRSFAWKLGAAGYSGLVQKAKNVAWNQQNKGETTAERAGKLKASARQ